MKHEDGLRDGIAVVDVGKHDVLADGVARSLQLAYYQGLLQALQRSAASLGLAFTSSAAAPPVMPSAKALGRMAHAVCQQRLRILYPTMDAPARERCLANDKHDGYGRSIVTAILAELARNGVHLRETPSRPSDSATDHATAANPTPPSTGNGGDRGRIASWSGGFDDGRAGDPAE